MDVIAVDQQGGKGNCCYAENVMPTLCSDSHGTPHALCYEVKMDVIGVDCYNLCGTGSIGRTLATSSCGLNEHIPVIIVLNDQGGGSDGYQL